MKLKLDENGNVVLKDGHPVYIYPDGKEMPFNAEEAMAGIARRNAEAKQHRERAEAAEAKLATFEGIEDPAAARKALATVASLDQNKLIEAGQVDKLKNELNSAWETKHKTVVDQLAEANQRIRKISIGGSFARSEFIKKNLLVPSDIAESFFGSHFSVDDNGAIVAKDRDGNPIYSRARPGSVADFDEALEALVDSYPNKNAILRGDTIPGAGTQPGSGGSGGSGNTLKRAAFAAKSPAEQMEFVRGGGTVVSD